MEAVDELLGCIEALSSQKKDASLCRCVVVVVVVRLCIRRNPVRVVVGEGGRGGRHVRRGHRSMRGVGGMTFHAPGLQADYSRT